MRMRLLWILLVALSALGADCGGGESSTAASSSTGVSFAGQKGGPGGFAPAVPEPSAMLLFGMGLAIAGAATRRKR